MSHVHTPGVPPVPAESTPTSASDSDDLARLTLDFLAYLELERGLSRNTLEAYRIDLLQFGEFLRRRDLSTLDVEHRDLAAFLSGLADGTDKRPAVAPATLQRKAACLRSFYRHLRREGLLERDPTAELRGPPRLQKLPLVLTREEVSLLLRQPAGMEPLALRDRGLLEIMYACGLRASETIALELGDVDLEEGMLRARGKGSKERIVPVGSAAVGALRAWCERGRPDAPWCGCRCACALPQPPWPAAHAPGSLQDRAGPRPLCRALRAHEPAHAASHLRHAPARGRL